MPEVRDHLAAGLRTRRANTQIKTAVSKTGCLAKGIRPRGGGAGWGGSAKNITFFGRHSPIK